MLKDKANSRSRDNLSFAKNNRIKVDNQNNSLQKSDASTESRRSKLLITANNIALRNNVCKNKQNIDQNRGKISMSKRQANSIEKVDTKKCELKKTKDSYGKEKEINKIDNKQIKGRTFRDVRQKVAKQAVVKKNPESSTKQRSLRPKTNNKSSKISLVSNNSKKEGQNHLCVHTQGQLCRSSTKESQFSPATKASANDSIWKYIPHEIIININQISIEQFTIIEQISHGSYFRENLAVHSPTNCIFTLRVMDKAQIMEDQLVQQLCEAIKIQLYLSRNPRCCSGFQKLYAVFCDAINVYLIMEPIPYNHQNYLLSEKIKEHGGLPEEEIAYILKTILTSLRDIHSEGIILRKISPDRIRNCLGIWKIVNMDQAASVRKRRRHSFLGDISQISHQLASGSTYGLGYDMWTVGLLLYFLATGKNPFSFDSLKTIKSLDFAFPLLLSSPLLDLLSRLLVEEPYRLNCQQSLTMPFVNHEFGGRELVSREVWSFWMN